MARFLHHGFKDTCSKCSESILALSWVLGLISGSVLALPADTFHLSLMRMTLERPVSIVRLLPVVFLPFLFSWFAVSIRRTWLFIPIAFTKALIFAAVSVGIMMSFGNAGWLIGFLMMFSSVCTIPILLFYWLRNISGRKAVGLRDMFPIVFTVLLVCAVDFYFISPILARL